MRIFISHPCGDNVPLRREQNRALIERLQRKYPDALFLSPLLLFDYMDDEGDFRDDIMQVCFEMIEYLADEVWVFGNSEGCREEVEFAESVGIPIKTKGEVL